MRFEIVPQRTLRGPSCTIPQTGAWSDNWTKGLEVWARPHQPFPPRPSPGLPAEGVTAFVHEDRVLRSLAGGDVVEAEVSRQFVAGAVVVLAAGNSATGRGAPSVSRFGVNFPSPSTST